MNNNIYDTIIIGSGPAGISCAIYLKRYNLNPIIITKGIGSLENAKISNYYGIVEIDGKDLYNKGLLQAEELGIKIINSEALEISLNNDFVVKTKDDAFYGKSIFIATGKAKNKSNYKNNDLYMGKGVSYCATCDGFFFRNKKIGIIGSGDFMLNELDVLKNITNDITIFSDGDIIRNDKYLVVPDKIEEFIGDDKFKGIRTSNKTYELDGVFVALKTPDILDFSRHLGLKVKDGFLSVDDNYMTNIKGIFAGGDAIGGFLQVSKAVSDGAIASRKIKEYIKK